MTAAPKTEAEDGEIAVIVDVVTAAWGDAVPELESLVAAAARAAVAGAPVAVPAMAELGVRLTDDAEIRTLNKSWRDRDAATNVLAFALNDSPAPSDPEAAAMLGDVVVALETCVAEARDQDKALADHLSHLVVHGTLHLLGFDHENDGEADAMEALERVVLRGLGVPDPYLDHEAA